MGSSLSLKSTLLLTARSTGQAIFICSLSLRSAVSIPRGCYLGKVFIMDEVNSSALWEKWVSRGSATSGVPCQISRTKEGLRTGMEKSREAYYSIEASTGLEVAHDQGSCLSSLTTTVYCFFVFLGSSLQCELANPIERRDFTLVI